MAIDTAEKRRSAGGVAFLPLGPGVSPHAGQDQAWRQQAGWGYGGIAAAAPTNVAVSHVLYEGLRRNVGRMLH